MSMRILASYSGRLDCPSSQDCEDFGLAPFNAHIIENGFDGAHGVGDTPEEAYVDAWAQFVEHGGISKLKRFVVTSRELWTVTDGTSVGAEKRTVLYTVDGYEEKDAMARICAHLVETRGDGSEFEFVSCEALS